jgi:hypothetical protein
MKGFNDGRAGFEDLRLTLQRDAVWEANRYVDCFRVVDDVFVIGDSYHGSWYVVTKWCILLLYIMVDYGMVRD